MTPFSPPAELASPGGMAPTNGMVDDGDMSDHQHDHGFLPGCGHRLLTPLYDTMSRFSGAKLLHTRLVDLARIEPGQQVLDLGTGTGAVALRVAGQHPDVTVVGVDPDPEMLDRARRKAADERVRVAFQHGFAEDLPFEDDQFDRVLSSLALHHVHGDGVQTAAAEIRRVLKPGGVVLIADFTPEKTHSHGLLSRLLHRTGAVPEIHGVDVAGHLRTAGFTDVADIAHEQLRFLGKVRFTRAIV